MTPLAPRCQRVVTVRKQPRVCGTRCVQNDIERGRGVWWCPACSRYAFGSGGGRAGGGADRIPAEAWA